jgi:hypothetical protein
MRTTEYECEVWKSSRDFSGVTGLMEPPIDCVPTSKHVAISQIRPVFPPRTINTGDRKASTPMYREELIFELIDIPGLVILH